MIVLLGCRVGFARPTSNWEVWRNRTPASAAIDDWQYHMRWARLIMKDLIVRWDGIGGGFSGDRAAGVCIAIEAREVAAGNIDPNTVAGAKHIRCGDQIDMQLVDRTRR